MGKRAHRNRFLRGHIPILGPLRGQSGALALCAFSRRGFFSTLLGELVSRIPSILGDDFVGVYLQGSFAIGDYDEHSDVDFIVVLEEGLNPQQVDALQVMHDEVYQLDSEWAKHLEGSYFPGEVLRDQSKLGTLARSF